MMNDCFSLIRIALFFSFEFKGKKKVKNFYFSSSFVSSNTNIIQDVCIQLQPVGVYLENSSTISRKPKPTVKQIIEKKI